MGTGLRSTQTGIQGRKRTDLLGRQPLKRARPWRSLSCLPNTTPKGWNTLLVQFGPPVLSAPPRRRDVFIHLPPFPSRPASAGRTALSSHPLQEPFRPPARLPGRSPRARCSRLTSPRTGTPTLRRRRSPRAQGMPGAAGLPPGGARRTACREL